MVNHLSLCAGEVRRYDWDRYLCNLFSPREKRDELFTILALNVEIDRIRESASEPIFREIRIRWWERAINSIYDGDEDSVKGHYVLSKLPKIIRKNTIDKQLIERLILARIITVTGQFEDEASIVRYAKETSGLLNLILLRVLSASNKLDEKALELGTAWGLIELIRAQPFFVKNSLSIIPKSKFGNDQSPGTVKESTADAAKNLCSIANTHLINASEIPHKATKLSRSVFLPLILANYYFKQLSDNGYDPFLIDNRGKQFQRQLMVAIGSLFRNY